MALLIRPLQFGCESLVLPFMESQISLFESSLFSATNLAGDQIRNVGQLSRIIQADEIRLDLSRVHEIDAGQQNSIDVQKRLHMRRIFLLEKLPLCGSKAQIVVSMVLRNAIRRQGLQFVVL